MAGVGLFGDNEHASTCEPHCLAFYVVVGLSGLSTCLLAAWWLQGTCPGRNRPGARQAGGEEMGMLAPLSSDEEAGGEGEGTYAKGSAIGQAKRAEKWRQQRGDAQAEGETQRLVQASSA